jgi:hypothetical protein
MSDTIKLLDPAGNEGDYPVAAKDALLAAGFREPMPPQRENTILVARAGAEVDAAWLTDEGREALLATGSWAWKVADEDVGPKPFLVRGTVTMIAAGLPEAAVTAMLANGYEWAAEDPNVAPEPAFVWPDDDAKVEILIEGMPTAIEMPFKDARGLVEQRTAKIVGDDELQVRVLDALDKADDKAVAADARSGAEAMDPPQAGPAGNLDKGLTEGPSASGKFAHPALPGKEYATKGAVTQALNRLAKEGSASGPATVSQAGSPEAGSANGAATEGPLEKARNLLSELKYTDDFDKLLKLFDEVAGKRNIGEFTPAELDALVAKLEAEKAGATA